VRFDELFYCFEFEQNGVLHDKVCSEDTDRNATEVYFDWNLSLYNETHLH